MKFTYTGEIKRPNEMIFPANSNSKHQEIGGENRGKLKEVKTEKKETKIMSLREKKKKKKR